MRTRTRITASGSALAVLGVTAISAVPASAQTAYPIPNPNQPVVVGTTAVIAPGATNVTLPATVTQVTVTATGPGLTITKIGDLKADILGPAPVTINTGGVAAKLEIKSSGSGTLSVPNWVDKGGSTITSAGPLNVGTAGSGAGTGSSKLESTGGNSTIDLTPKPAGRAATRAAGDGFIAYTVKTATGRDIIKGGNGKLTAYAGAGNDAVTGGAGGGRLSGQAGNDTLKGGAGAVSLLGGAGNDKAYAGKGKATISGGAGNDYSSSVNGVVDSISGGGGKDKARAGKRDKVSRSVEGVKRSAKN